MLKSFSPCKAEGMYGINVWIPKELNSFAEHHSMIQIACEATMEDALLDPIFTISYFADSAVNTLPPVGGSDHAAQLIQLRTTFSNKASTKRKVVDYTKLGHVLSQIDWSFCFNNFANVDNYAAKFNDTLLRALSNSTHHKLSLMTRCYELCLTVPTTSLSISGVACQSM